MLQDFQPNIGLSVHVTEMGVQWLMLCKPPVFVYMICGGDARRKGKGLPLGVNTCRTALAGIVIAKNPKGLEGMLPLGLCCLCQ